MPDALTRRRDRTVPQISWRVYFGDVDVGAISECVGNPGAAPRWQWRVGFYPGSRPGECTNGTAASFEEARAAFETSWRVFLSKRTEADFDEHRRYHAREAWKHAMWETGCKLPTQVADGQSRCFCGAEIAIADVEQHVYAEHR